MKPRLSALVGHGAFGAVSPIQSWLNVNDDERTPTAPSFDITFTDKSRREAEDAVH